MEGRTDKAKTIPPPDFRDRGLGDVSKDFTICNIFFIFFIRIAALKPYPSERGPLCFNCQKGTALPGDCETVVVCGRDEVNRFHVI